MPTYIMEKPQFSMGKNGNAAVIIKTFISMPCPESYANLDNERKNVSAQRRCRKNQQKDI
jgi:hypothetical protein